MNTEENKELKKKILKEVGYYVPYICKSNEWSNKAHQDIISLGNLQLSKKPLKDNWGDDWNDNPSDCNSGSAYDNDLWLELETNKKVIYTKEDILKVIDLTFDEVTKQAEKRFIEKVERLDKQFKHTLNEESLLFFEKRIVEKFYKKFNEIFSDEQKLTNHTPPQVTENRNSVLPRLANGSQQTEKGYPKEQKIKNAQADEGNLDESHKTASAETIKNE
jgi:hypothetical protein